MQILFVRMRGGMALKTISKLSDNCRECKHVYECKNKRMVACAMKEHDPNRSNATAPITSQYSQPVKRIEHQITINMGEYGIVNTSIEEIAEKLKKDLYKNLNCSFNR